MLGNKNAAMLEVFAHDPVQQQVLRETLVAPSLYDEFLRYLARKGPPCPRRVCNAIGRSRIEHNPDLVEPLRRIYAAPARCWAEYHMCESSWTWRKTSSSGVSAT